MKSVKLLFFFLLLPFVFYAQRTTLTGLWTGTMTNDSTAIQQDQSIEIALSQYKQKVTGYSRVTFIINDTLYNVIKRVKGTISGNVCEVTDDEIITHNFPVKPEKKVKRIYTFLFNPQDSTWRMDGKWRTTKTKEFYSISGKTELKEETDYNKSKLFPHLEELSLADDVPFYKEAKQAAKESIAQTKNSAPSSVRQEASVLKSKPDVDIIKDENKEINKEESKSEIVATAKTSAEIKKTDSLLTNPQKIKTEPVVINVVEEKKPETTKIPKPAKADPVVVIKAEYENKNQDSSSANLQKIKSEPVAVKPVEEKKPEVIRATKPKPATTDPVAVTKADEKKTDIQIVKPEPVKSEPVVISKPEEKKPVIANAEKPKPADDKPAMVMKSAEEKKQSIEEPKKPEISTAKQVSEKLKTDAPVAAVSVNERKTVSTQSVTFKSDSLMLSLYDNGEIDGDTVSVLLNGEIILAKQGLKAAAIRKTIYIEPGSNELTLVLYAENLGKYPPNTGLLVVHDGEDVYQLRFSADLQQNAAIIFRRKK